MPWLYKQCRSRSVDFFRSQLIWICSLSLSTGMRIFINNLDQVIWLVESYEWVWHLSLFSMARLIKLLCKQTLPCICRVEQARAQALQYSTDALINGTELMEDFPPFLQGIFHLFYKGDNFCDFLFAFLHTWSLLFFFFFFWFGFYGPFKNISLISSRSFIEGGRKPENPQKNNLTIRKQNLAFPHMTRARLEPQRWET